MYLLAIYFRKKTSTKNYYEELFKREENFFYVNQQDNAMKKTNADDITKLNMHIYSIVWKPDKRSNKRGNA